MAAKDRARGARAGDGKTQAVTLRVPQDLHEAMRTYAFATNSTVNDLAIRAIYRFLAAEGRQEQVDAVLKKATTQYRVVLDKLSGPSRSANGADSVPDG